jgi:hypothetical protein
MIDFKRFWAEPGCAPGMSKEETEAYLKQHAPGIPLEALRPNWALDPGPGVSVEQIDRWERAHRVRLPDVLRRALALQDGGYVRENAFRVFPLAEIVPNDDEFWEYACYDEEDVPDRSLVFQFGEDEFGGTCHLIYARGPQGEPSVYVYHSDPGDLDHCADSITQFFDRMLKTAEAPSVHWSETESLEVVARETIDLSRLYRKPAKRELILGRQGGALVLFTHERAPDQESFTKTTLPEPLVQQIALIQRHRPDPVSTYSLILQPKVSDGIVEVESKRTSDGKWKNGETNGVPICVLFESHDRSRLDTLRRTLFGEKAAARAQAQEERQEELQQKMGALSPGEVQAAGLSMFQHMKERLFPGGSPPNMPPEAAALQELLQMKLAEIEQRLREKNAGQPMNPEIQRLLREAMPPPAEAGDAENQ